MDPNSYALVLYEGNKSRHDLFINEKKLSSASAIEESELLQQHQINQSMITDSRSSDNEVIDAIPLSYRLPELPNMSTRNEKNGSLSGKSTPNSRRTTVSLEEKYSANWRIEARQREKNKRWDKYYIHRTKKVRCRSLKEVERFETKGIRPTRSGKGKKRENTEEAVKEMGANETQEMSLARKRREAEQMRIIVEKFLADAYYNQLHLYNGHQHLPEDFQKTLFPSAI